MPIDESNPIQHIEKRVRELQSAYVLMQEKLKKSQHDFERTQDERALKIIDVLDMIERAQSNSESMGEIDESAAVILNKIKKRLVTILQDAHIQEIHFPNGTIIAGKVRVLETRQASAENPSGAIVEICRKGYQRGDKIIRPADVITAS